MHLNIFKDEGLDLNNLKPYQIWLIVIPNNVYTVDIKLNQIIYRTTIVIKQDKSNEI